MPQGSLTLTLTPTLTLTLTPTLTLTLTLTPSPAPAPAPSPSTRYRKESIKGKLHDRFINNKKGKSVDSRHVTLSIEGRTLDRLN